MKKIDYQSVPLDEKKNLKENFIVEESQDDAGKKNPLKLFKEKLAKKKENKKKGETKDKNDVSFIQLVVLNIFDDF
jgi:hypothetical protein